MATTVAVADLTAPLLAITTPMVVGMLVVVVGLAIVAVLFAVVKRFVGGNRESLKTIVKDTWLEGLRAAIGVTLIIVATIALNVATTMVPLTTFSIASIGIVAYFVAMLPYILPAIMFLVGVGLIAKAVAGALTQTPIGGFITSIKMLSQLSLTEILALFEVF